MTSITRSYTDTQINTWITVNGNLVNTTNPQNILSTATLGGSLEFIFTGTLNNPGTITLPLGSTSDLLVLLWKTGEENETKSAQFSVRGFNELENYVFALNAPVASDLLWSLQFRRFPDLLLRPLGSFQDKPEPSWTIPDPPAKPGIIAKVKKRLKK